MSPPILTYATRVKRSQGSSKTLLAIVVALVGFNGGASAGAQVTVAPATSRAGVTERYLLRVENDRQQPVTRVEIGFPRSVNVVSLGEHSGWEEQPRVAGNRLSAVVWTGSLAPGRFSEFGFIGVNPATTVRLVWPVIITYADSARSVWWTGSSPLKAPVTLVASPSHNSRNLTIALGVCLVALVLALSALFLALRSEPPTDAGFQAGAG